MSKAATKTSPSFFSRRREEQQARSKVRELAEAISNGRPLQRDRSSSSAAATSRDDTRNEEPAGAVSLQRSRG